jgi:hypothetical protein
MNASLTTILLAAVFAGAANAHAAQRPHSHTILVEPPSELPEMAQIGGEAMYLQSTGDGQAILYIETNGGQKLSILNVTDPAKVKGVAQVAIGAQAPFDFVQTLGDSAVLIRYRDHSGFAVLGLRKYNHPILAPTSQRTVAGSVENLGETGLLLTSTANVGTQAATAFRTYDVLDTSNPSYPVALATVDGVVQRISRDETGTLFLLSSKGVTMVRRPRVEEEYAIQQIQLEGN